MLLYRYLPDAVSVPRSIPCQRACKGSVRDASAYVLIDKQDSNIFSLLCEAVECLFYGRVFGFGVDYKEVLLCIRRLRDMLLSTWISMIGLAALDHIEERKWYTPLCLPVADL